MSWEDRIRPAAYTSPGGKRYTFDYEDVSKSWDKKTTAFEFADADGTYIQDLGRTGRRLPMRFIFWGGDYDVDANNFELALAESGAGTLDHPMYGTIKVVPFGSIARRDDLKTRANQAIIECTMFETTDIIYPTAGIDASAAVAEAITNFIADGAITFEQNMSLASLVEQALAKNPIATALNTFKTGLQTIADTQADIAAAQDAVFNSINDGLDTLIGAPLTLAFQTSIMIGAPGRALALFTDKLEAYADLARDIFGINDGAGAEPGVTTENANNYYINALFAENAVAGTAISAASTQFDTKTEVIGAADSILTLYNELTAWQDTNLESLGKTDTGESFQALQQVISLTTGYLVEISFTLLQEKSFITTKERNYLELTAELYGDISDERQNFFINSNHLTGSEILEIPRGREIVYYV